MKFDRQEKEKLKTALRGLITESYQSYYELRKKLGDRWQVGHIASVIQEMTHEIEWAHIETGEKIKHGPLTGMPSMKYVVRKRPIEGMITARVIDAIWNSELEVFIAHLIPLGGAVQTKDLIGKEIVVGKLLDFVETNL